MRFFRRKSARAKIKDPYGFWLAFIFAMSLHAIFLLVPVPLPAPDKERVAVQVDLQLGTIYKEAVSVQEPEPQSENLPEKSKSEPLPDPLTKPAPIPAVPEKLAATPLEPVSPVLLPAPPAREPQQDLEKMTPAQKTRLTNAILSRQFISEESEADKIFGKPITLQSTEPQKGFHYPARQNMMTMLDQPLPELPFAYTPDLVYFAYDPGVRGDLQRFWDVITPEFGWRTDNGTEFKCKWILIIAACGWK